MDREPIRKNKNVINIAHWINEHAHLVRETGLLLFALALFVGIFWAAGKDLEPIVYLLGSLGTLLLSGPLIARYVQPGRKPVRHMNYNEILDYIVRSDEKNDWKWIKTNSTEEAFLKEDPRLRIRVRWDDTGIHVKDFNETWAITHSNPAANSYLYDLYYDGALINSFILVSVDGGQAVLPMPDSTTLEVDPLNYKVAQIIDRHNTLDKYMSKSGLSIKST